MATLRLHLLLGTALVVSAGCAQQPVKADYTSPTAMSATAPTSAASAATLTGAFSPRLLVFAYEQGWRQVVVSGNNHYFCRADVPSGSLIASDRCVTQADLQSEQLLVQQQQEKLRQPIPYLPQRYP